MILSATTGRAGAFGGAVEEIGSCCVESDCLRGLEAMTCCFALDQAGATPLTHCEGGGGNIGTTAIQSLSSFALVLKAGDVVCV
jgi:hypothetical protein